MEFKALFNTGDEVLHASGEKQMKPLAILHLKSTAAENQSTISGLMQKHLLSLAPTTTHNVRCV